MLSPSHLGRGLRPSRDGDPHVLDAVWVDLEQMQRQAGLRLPQSVVHSSAAIVVAHKQGTSRHCSGQGEDARQLRVEAGLVQRSPPIRVDGAGQEKLQHGHVAGMTSHMEQGLWR